ncbi:hypothetical protein [Streptomyces sp. NPDC006134]|uniref:hypothetical protein n=1 Tax=Streptomyces sp. NPDC006134 TaxID=3154467 RepID=UPI0033C3A2A1
MTYSEKALANGWGWVLGVSGQECRVTRAAGRAAPRRAEPTSLSEALVEIGEALKVEFPTGADDGRRMELVLDAIQRLHDGRERALASAALARRSLRELRSERGGAER